MEKYLLEPTVRRFPTIISLLDASWSPGDAT